MHTEEQAKEFWCPMVTSANGASVRIAVSGHQCIASDCAVWRWNKDQPDGVGYHGDGTPSGGRATGYCGLAGLPR